MGDIAIAIEAPREVLEELHALEIEGVSFSIPTAVRSPSDALDSPIGAGEIRTALELMTLLFTTAKAAVAFADSLLAVLRKHDRNVTFKNVASGEAIGNVGPNSEPTAIVQMLHT